MQCPKFQRRAFLNLFAIFKCDCARKEDQKIEFGNTFLYFLYLEFLCDALFTEEEKALYYYKGSSAKTILWKLARLDSEIVVCWVKKEEEIEAAMPLFEELLDQQVPIFILCEN